MRTCRRRSGSSRLRAVCSTSSQGRTNELRHEFSDRRSPFDLHRPRQASFAHLSVEETSHIRDERRVRLVPKDTSRRATLGTGVDLRLSRDPLLGGEAGGYDNSFWSFTSASCGTLGAVAVASFGC